MKNFEEAKLNVVEFDANVVIATSVGVPVDEEEDVENSEQ